MCTQGDVFFFVVFFFPKCQNAFRSKSHQDGGSGLNPSGVTEFSEHLHKCEIHRLQQEEQHARKSWPKPLKQVSLKHNTEQQKTFLSPHQHHRNTEVYSQGTRHPAGENGPAFMAQSKERYVPPLVHMYSLFFFFFFFYENLQPALPTLMKRVSIVKKAQEKLPALTSWQKYLWVYPPVGLRGVGGWQLLKSVFFVGERSYSLRENTFFASSTVGRKKKSPLYPRLFGGGAVTC